MLEQFGKEATDLRWLSLVNVRGEKTKGPYMSIALRMRLRRLFLRGFIFAIITQLMYRTTVPATQAPGC